MVDGSSGFIILALALGRLTGGRSRGGRLGIQRARNNNTHNNNRQEKGLRCVRFDRQRHEGAGKEDEARAR